MKVVTSDAPARIDADDHVATDRRTAAYGRMAAVMRTASTVDEYRARPMD
jgi:hypothetical protein